MPYFAFVSTNAVIVSKIDKLQVNIKRALPEGELPTESGERGRISTLSVSLRLPPLPKGEAFSASLEISKELLKCQSQKCLYVAFDIDLMFLIKSVVVRKIDKA